MLKVAICDDESLMAGEISDRLSRYMQDRRMTPYSVGSFSSGRSLLESGYDFDVIFLDIRMEGTDGLETARALRERGGHSLLIFVTVLKECVFDAFEVEAFDYLVKPLDADRFRKTMDRALRTLERQLSAETDEAKIRDLEAKLKQVEGELRQKDNDTYRRHHAEFSRGR